MIKNNLDTTCCIVGGGPAGIMLGLLLARKGVHVTVLEKHKDFFRDFRGDTVHPSTLELLYELGILDDFLQVPHQKLTSAGGVIGGHPFHAANFRHVPAHCQFIALMPQWDFLDFLTRHAQTYRGFDIRMEHEVLDLVEERGRITGVKVRTPQGSVEIRADLVIGCDGRHAITSRAAKLEVEEVGVPIDVLWFRLSRSGDDPEQLLGNINQGKLLILIPRGTYFQAGMIVRKDSFEEIKQKGLAAFRDSLKQVAPYLGKRVQEVQDWKEIKLLSIQINRLRRWHRPGLLCIGDAAHAMSPVGGVGINLAIQDAVATANIFSEPLREGQVSEALAAKLQRRREFPTRATQFAQVKAHKVLARAFDNPGPAKIPWQLKVLPRVPGVQRLVARLIGIGVRPEHIAGARKRSASRGRLILLAACAGAAVGTGVVTLRSARAR